MLKRYGEYKQVDSPWIPEIPSHWNKTTLRTILTNIVDKGHPEQQLLSVTREKGVILRNVTSKEENHNYIPDDLSNYKLVKKGQFVINKMKSWQGSYGIAEYEGIVSPAYFVFDLQFENKYYFNKAIRSKSYIPLFAQHSVGIRVGQWDLDVSKLKNFPFYVPPRAEQDQIVLYLDWKTAEMNRFIHEKKKQIKKLEELKISKINELITKGINRTAKYKSSNVEWIGDIPDYWEIDYIKQHFTVKKRIAGEEGYSVLSITQQGIKEKNIASNEGQMAQSYENYQFVYPGEFAMNHMDLITGYIDISSKFGVTSPDYRVFVLTDTDKCYAPFYLRVFQIGYKRRIFYKFGKGAAHQGRWRLPMRAFYDFPIQIPPLEEQKEIVSHCDNIEEKIDAMIEGIRREISLVEELKVRLISDVVTGQVDVRDVVIPEYEKSLDLDASEEDFAGEEDDPDETMMEE